MVKTKKNKSFQFKPFSPKQRQLIHWWRGASPHSDCDIVIADGAIRSGKTIACICSFLMWSLEVFDSQNFILAGVRNRLKNIRLKLNIAESN